MTNSHLEVKNMKSIYPNLTKKMIEHNMSNEDLADIIDTTGDVVSLKMSGHSTWSLCDAVRICCHFDLSDIRFLFFQLDNNS